MVDSVQVDLGGNDLIVKNLRVGATEPGQAGTEITGAEIILLDGLTPGTATASKAVVLGASKEIATITTATITNLTSTTITPTTIAGTPNFSGAPTFATTSAFTGVATFSAVPVLPAGGLTAGSTTITEAEIGVLDSASAANSGTGKAMITGTSGALTVAGVATFNANPTFGAGFTLNLDSAPASLTSHAVTLTKHAGVITTEALTTAAGSSQAFVLTLTGVAAGDLAFVTAAGGTNTREHYVYKAITTTNTITVTVTNVGAADALNGTLIFNLWVVKA